MVTLMVACLAVATTDVPVLGQAASVRDLADGFVLTNDIVELRLDEGGVLRWLSRADGGNLLALFVDQQPDVVVIESG